MKIDFTTEILKGFAKQYPKKVESYEKLIHGKQRDVIEGVEIYDDLIECHTFMIKLIRDLKGLNKSSYKTRKVK